MDKSDKKVKISVAYGDGIGPEIMAATLNILKAAEARVEFLPVKMGIQAYEAGYKSGITPKAWDTIRQTKILLKAPVTTPPDSRFKSLNVLIRKKLGLYANIRPCVAYHPFIKTRHPGMNLVIIRENEEDIYAGLEHRHTTEVIQCAKLISKPGCEKIIRFAFEYARSHFRRKVTCFTKDNIMKMTDGLFHKTFKNIALEYPDIEHDHWIIDVGAAHVADMPEQFDVLVTPNLYGDMLTDMTAQLAGTIGIAGSANLGKNCAMFETVHGLVSHRTNQDEANPSGLLMAAIMMLLHIGQPDIAEWIHNAWLKTIEDGIHTYDIYDPNLSQQKVGTQAFSQAVIERLGKEPEKLKPIQYQNTKPIYQIPPYKRPAIRKELVGVDVFLDWSEGSPADLAAHLNQVPSGKLGLQAITNRGVLVWPQGFPETFCTDFWRCRFVEPDDNCIQHEDVIHLLEQLTHVGLEFIKTEHLYEFSGKKGYSIIPLKLQA